MQELGLEEVHGSIISNPQDEKMILLIHLDPPQRHYIPAHASFILDTFPSASSALTAYTHERGRFDLIILDPPWRNKAVSRLKTKKHSAYNTMTDIFAELPPVGNWLAPGGIVAIWCTNNLKMITKVKTILFKRWRVELVAEWVWLKVYPSCTCLTKVTTHGEPVVSMSSSFRKPYEILLLARKPSVQNTLEIPKNKVLIAVPGYHSQKPCLKGTSPEIVLTSGIFDGILPEGSRVCELYARNLVEGWMSVGEECLKFMRDNYWKQIPKEEQ